MPFAVSSNRSIGANSRSTPKIPIWVLSSRTILTLSCRHPYLIVNYESLDAIIARQPGKRRLERIPVNEAAPDHASHIVSAWTPDLASVPEEEAWQKAVKRFKIPIPRTTIRSDVASSSHDRAVRRQIRNHGPALLPDGTDPDVGQQTNTDLHRSLSRLERNALVR